MPKAKIIGCGLSGITSAILLKEAGYDVTIYEERNHIGGNCHDSNVIPNNEITITKQIDFARDSFHYGVNTSAALTEFYFQKINLL